MAALLTANTSDYSHDMVNTTPDLAADEAAWIRQAQRSDAQAFEALYRLHVDKIYGLCLRMTGNVSEAEDCVQEAFIQAWNKMEKFRGDSAFSTWLHRIAVNTVLGRIRKSKREQDRIQVVADTRPAPLEAGDSGELLDGVEARPMPVPLLFHRGRFGGTGPVSHPARHRYFYGSYLVFLRIHACWPVS